MPGRWPRRSSGLAGYDWLAVERDGHTLEIDRGHIGDPRLFQLGIGRFVNLDAHELLGLGGPVGSVQDNVVELPIRQKK